MQDDLLREALAKKELGHPLLASNLYANPNMVNAARWPQSRCNSEVATLRWRNGPLGSARRAIAMAQSHGPRMSRFPTF